MLVKPGSSPTVTKHIVAVEAKAAQGREKADKRYNDLVAFADAARKTQQWQTDSLTANLQGRLLPLADSLAKVHAANTANIASADF